jgi:hypothetical protein
VDWGASVHDNTGTERGSWVLWECAITRGRIPACFCSFRMWEDCELRCDTRDHNLEGQQQQLGGTDVGRVRSGKELSEHTGTKG